MSYCIRDHCWKKSRAKRKSITLRVRVDPGTAAMIEQLQTIIISDYDENGRPRTTTRTTSEILRQAVECLFKSPKERRMRERLQKRIAEAMEEGRQVPAPKYIDGRIRAPQFLLSESSIKK
jgi:hypothetical protein